MPSLLTAYEGESIVTAVFAIFRCTAAGRHDCTSPDFVCIVQGYVHRDITSYNLLLTEQWECKVADFNLSRAIKENQIPHSGGFNSIEWQAPERLSGKVRPQLNTASSLASKHCSDADPLGPLSAALCQAVRVICYKALLCGQTS